MGWRFQRHLNTGLGRINISKSGISLSEGVRGAHITIGRTPRITLGIPGSGISWTETMGRGRSRSSASPVALFLGALLGLGIGIAILSLIVAYG